MSGKKGVPEYLLSKDAALDLDSIWLFIAEDSVTQAGRWIAILFAAMDSIARSPGN